MRHYYAARRGGREVARLTLDWDPDVADDFAFVRTVWTSPSWRGQGVAGNLLRRVLADADREGVELQLNAQPLDGGGLTLAQLRDWYGRHGFSYAGMAGGYSRRTSQTEQVAA